MCSKILRELLKIVARYPVQSRERDAGFKLDFDPSKARFARVGIIGWRLELVWCIAAPALLLFESDNAVNQFRNVVDC
jgi:hypothetical protein